MTSNESKILVFVPAYRCAKQIERVLQQFTLDVQSLFHTVMVVDNQSPDNTLEVAQRIGKNVFSGCRFIVWLNQDNYGLGGSHKAAMRYAISQGFTHVVVLHGDDQANINDIVPLIRSGRFLNNDCLLGARFMKGSSLIGYSTFRRLGNQVYNALFSVVMMKAIWDLGSGLNMYRLDTLKSFYYEKFPDDLTFNYLMLLGSFDRKQKILFFPISWREEDQVSNVRLVRQAFKVLYLLARYAVGRSKFLMTDNRSRKFENYTGKIVFHQEVAESARVSL